MNNLPGVNQLNPPAATRPPPAWLIMALIVLGGCAPPAPAPTATLPPTLTSTPTIAPTDTPTATPTLPPTANPPGGGGRIAIHHMDDDGIFQIYLMNPDGSGETQLTFSEQSIGSATRSQDGSRIVFARPNPDKPLPYGAFDIWDIFVMNADGSNVTFIADHDPVSGKLSWSPDGSRLAFDQWWGEDIDSYRFDIFVMNADGSNPTRLTLDEEWSLGPVWSPDGELILFSRFLPEEIFVMNADGSNPINLTNLRKAVDSGPSWSPDGSRIAFSSDRDGHGGYEIYVMNADGSNPTRLTFTTDQFNSGPIFSPDGTLIVFSSTPISGNTMYGHSDIYVMNADGSNLTNLTNSPDFDESAQAWLPY